MKFACMRIRRRAFCEPLAQFSLSISLSTRDDLRLRVPVPRDKENALARRRLGASWDVFLLFIVQMFIDYTIV